MLTVNECQTFCKRERNCHCCCWELRTLKPDVTEQVQFVKTRTPTKKDTPNNDMEETTSLFVRPFRYQGKAGYQKEITIPAGIGRGDTPWSEQN